MSLADQILVFRQGTIAAGRGGRDTTAAELVSILTGTSNGVGI